jgi:hypothetical protein
VRVERERLFFATSRCADVHAFEGRNDLTFFVFQGNKTNFVGLYVSRVDISELTIAPSAYKTFKPIETLFESKSIRMTRFNGRVSHLEEEI